MERHVSLLGILASLWGALAATIGVAMLLLSAGALAELLAPLEASLNFAAGLAAVGFALFGVFALVFGGVLLGKNDRSRRSVMRVFTGGRMALCLLITMLTVAGLAVALVQKDPDHEITESLLAILIVWFAAAVVHLVAFRVATREKREKGTKRNEDEEAWTPRG